MYVLDEHIMFVLQNRLKESLELFRSIWNNRFVWICFSFFRGIQVRSKLLHIIPVKPRYNRPKRSPRCNGRYFVVLVIVTKPCHGLQILTVCWPFVILYIFSPGNKGHLATQKNNY